MGGLLLPMLAGLLLGGCDDPRGRAIPPADLSGPWTGAPIPGRALSFFVLEAAWRASARDWLQRM